MTGDEAFMLNERELLLSCLLALVHELGEMR